MNTTEKTNEAVENAMTAFTQLLHRNVERMVGLQKAALEAFSQQSSDVAETMRQSLKAQPATAPGAAMLDGAEQGVQGWISAQKQALDSIVQQSAQAVETTQKRGSLAAQSMAELGDFVQQAAERTVAVQKTMLDFAAKQNKAVADAFRAQVGAVGNSPAATAAADSVQRGVATFIDTQKEFLDQAAKMAKTATSAKG